MSDSPSSVRARRSIPGYVAALASAALIVALPIVAQFVDGSADRFGPDHVPALPITGWLLCAALSAVVVTRLLQISVGVEEGSALALAYDALPLLLVIAWVVAIAAVVSEHWLLAVAAGGLCVYHVVLVVPRLIQARTPHWVRHAPRLQIAAANVFVDNETPDAAARQVIDTSADVLVLVESTGKFMRVFDECGGDAAYPHRIVDPDDESDYAVAIVAKQPLGPRSEFRHIGLLRLAIADVDVDGTSTLVVALNPMATVDPGGHVAWKEQIAVLEEFVPTLTGPVIIVGDLNTTRFRPEFEQILKLGFSDAIDSLGKGLKPSFKLQATGPLSAVGAVVRLDHALVNKDMHATEIRDLEACGSDHLPFVLDVAVRTTHGHHRRHHRRRHGRRRE